MFLFDLLWWRAADRMLRRLRRPTPWRLILGIFMVGQLACFGWIVFGRILGQDRRASGYSVFVTATYLWHMIVLLPTVLVFGAIATIGRLRAILRRSPSLGTPGEGRGRGSSST